ncbi:MAG: hypothetical protein H0X40_07190 [Chthoniobacterales bacterium]|nr:hypothetical protein [Chthoniobacterales bacterium]
MKRSLPTLILVLVSFFVTSGFAQTLGNAWHIPTNTIPSTSTTMRSPLSSIDPGATVTIYNGNQFQGSGNPGNQSGGAVFYKSASGSYVSVPLGFYSTSGNDKYWVASFTAPSPGPVQYYLQINYTDHTTTYLYGTDSTSNATADSNYASTHPYIFNTTPTLTVNGVSANYTTEHVYVDEIAGDSVSYSVVFSPDAVNVDPTTVQVYTNLNRRDYAMLPYTDANGIATEEGIYPPSGDVVGTNDSHYYKAYTMTASGGQYTLTLNSANAGLARTGAYRMTARYRLTGSSTWIYYTSNGRRDHAIVVSPVTARNLSLYEANVLNIDASGDQMAQRSTFADLHDSSKRWNLDYVKNLGSNFIWFQPIHPNGIDGRQTDPNTGLPFTVGSPYAVKNFFDVMELMGKDNTRPTAMSEFQGFVSASDTASVGIMLDAPFNHTSYDVELADQGVALIKPGSTSLTQIRSAEARFFSHGDLFNIANNNYCTRAASATDIAPAPDRNDFGKFGDTFDIYFGQYSALVCQNNQDNNNYLNENDVFQYGDTAWNSVDFTVGSVKNNITRNGWRYFASYIPYWLIQTGHSGVNSTAADGNAATRLALDSKGIDALRADFGQGLPPQAWEYIINVARSHKWNFVFMTESLDGGAVTYRSARHFDILNENIIFPFQGATQTSDYRAIFDSRRSAYGQGLVLLNSTSHDEQNYADPYQALIRYGVSNTIDGAPMIFYGQENGISTSFGFSHYEVNFGKYIPHFKVFNDLGPIIGNQTYGLQQLFPVYAAMGQARQFSPALRSSNRYYLNQPDGSAQTKIFSVAKYESANASPAQTDVVFGFMNLDRDNDQSGNFNVNITQNSANLFGVKRGRTYDVRNVAAYTAIDPNRRTYFLNRKTGDQLLDGGLFVGMKKVPSVDANWATAPFEAQYLKLYDVTAPTGTPGVAAPSNVYGYVVGNTATLHWTAAAPDSEGIVPTYKISVTINGNTTTYFTSGTTLSFSVTPGQTLNVTVQAVNPNDTNVGGATSAPATIKVIDPVGDDDGDGMTNSAEDMAATNPFSSNSILRVTDITRTSTTVSVTWSSVAGKVYQLESSSTVSGTYLSIGSPMTASGSSTSESVANATPAFYRVRVVQ